MATAGGSSVSPDTDVGGMPDREKFSVLRYDNYPGCIPRPVESVQTARPGSISTGGASLWANRPGARWTASLYCWYCWYYWLLAW